MSTLAVWDASPLYTPEPYVIQGQERPDDIPRLKESAATMEARVLEWFRGRFGVRGYMAQTPTMCAEALGLHLRAVQKMLRTGRKTRSDKRVEVAA